ncbi:hypothetical protein K1719_017187 [Acacia pycnantha]|nr:hypothetical protein K1719_017187 [Acacia pycnantha]
MGLFKLHFAQKCDDIPCGTKGGVQINFEKIQVVNRLRKEYVYETFLNYGLSTVYIDDFVQIGEEMKKLFNIRHNLEQLEEEHIQVLIAVERQKVAETESETSKKIALSRAEENANVSKILMAQTLLENEGSRCQQEIENQMYLQRERYRADANFYRATKEAEANRLKLAEYLKLKYIEAIVEIAKRSSYLVRLLQYLQLFARYFFH